MDPRGGADPGAGVTSNLGANREISVGNEPNARSGLTSTSAATTVTDTVSNYGALVFLIDGPSLDLKTRRRFALAWEELLATTDGLRIPRAVYLIDSFGTLDELVPLTLETDPLFEAVEAVRTTPTPGNSMKRKFYELPGWSFDCRPADMLGLPGHP